MDICTWRLVQTEGLCPAAVPLWGLPGTSPVVTAFFLRMTGQCICSPIAGEATGNEGWESLAWLCPKCWLLLHSASPVFSSDWIPQCCRLAPYILTSLFVIFQVLIRSWNFRHGITDLLTSTEKAVLPSLVLFTGWCLFLLYHLGFSCLSLLIS